MKFYLRAARLSLAAVSVRVSRASFAGASSQGSSTLALFVDVAENRLPENRGRRIEDGNRLQPEPQGHPLKPALTLLFHAVGVTATIFTVCYAYHWGI
jgi:hypothetical protein